MPDSFLRGWNIFDSPKDYPGKYVVRGWCLVADGGIFSDPEPHAVTDTLTAAIAELPGGLVCVAPTRADASSLVGTWI